MSFIFTDQGTGERLKSTDAQNSDEILSLLRRLTSPNSTLITKLPSGIGLDFEIQEDGRLWIELYANELSGAFVTREIGEEVIRRAFADGKEGVKERYRDLITNWEY
jgi:hypothetical protein